MISKWLLQAPHSINGKHSVAYIFLRHFTKHNSEIENMTLHIV